MTSFTFMGQIFGMIIGSGRLTSLMQFYTPTGSKVTLQAAPKLPAGFTAVYDPKYTHIDVVVAACLGIRAYREMDGKELCYYDRTRVPTVIWAPGWLHNTAYKAIRRAHPIENLILLTWEVKAWKFTVESIPDPDTDDRKYQFPHPLITRHRPGLIPFGKQMSFICHAI
ncbi:hypothetical protein CALVIDRAFT_559577 [Calocera viscosa TUFC12733]|uniref:Uncharacterized protein n=1 Tax=Calocera viscosa (strain TUFC12733) TaxID=1330018 RepID=A0A167SCE6_CALVF|nr:hypothetical protein CALVIDRAFT_559577 [Calocera viscosa TUFC12733]